MKLVPGDGGSLLTVTRSAFPLLPAATLSATDLPLISLHLAEQIVLMEAVDSGVFKSLA